MFKIGTIVYYFEMNIENIRINSNQKKKNITKPVLSSIQKVTDIDACRSG